MNHVFKDVKDKEHSEFLKRFLQLEGKSLTYWNNTSPKEGYPPTEVKLEVEYYFNHYGERGYMDIVVFNNRKYCIKCDRVHNSIEFYEIKPRIFDIGDTIRQIKKYYYVLEKVHSNYSHNYGCLVLPYTLENLEHFYENNDIYENGFKNLNAFDVKFYRNQNISLNLRYDNTDIDIKEWMEPCIKELKDMKVPRCYRIDKICNETDCSSCIELNSKYSSEEIIQLFAEAGFRIDGEYFNSLKKLKRYQINAIIKIIPKNVSIVTKQDVSKAFESKIKHLKNEL